MPVKRKRIELARLAGFGLVLAGVVALVLAVLSAQNAGAEKAAPRNAVLSCHHSSDDAIGQAVLYGACSPTTTTSDTVSETSTTWKHQCGCSTTTLYVQDTTTSMPGHCGCSTTSTSTAGSLPVSSVPNSTTPESTTPESTTPEDTTADTLGRQGAPVTSAGTGTTVAVEAVEAQLPFTGSSSFPLAGTGLVFVLTGLALALRKRRIAS